MNDYSKISAENASSRMATVSGEEAFMSDTKSNTGVLKWGDRRLMENKEFAYGDVEIYSVPVEGEIDRNKIPIALTEKFPGEPSQGRKRWFCGFAVFVEGEIGFKRSRFENCVTVEQHFALAGNPFSLNSSN